MTIHVAKDLRLVSIEALIPYSRNSRTHSSEQIDQIVASIREFGFTNPILIDGLNGIIAGHGRLAAAKKLGLKHVPVIDLSHLTETQKRAYVIADNKLSLNAGWDLELLASEIASLGGELEGWDAIGFSDDEISDLLAGVESIEPAPLPVAPPVAQVVQPQQPAASASIPVQGAPAAPASEVAAQHWQGMPEFHQENRRSVRHVIVYFADEGDAAAFFDAIQQKDTGITKSIWFPPQERMDTESKRYGE